MESFVNAFLPPEPENFLLRKGADGDISSDIPFFSLSRLKRRKKINAGRPAEPPKGEKKIFLFQSRFRVKRKEGRVRWSEISLQRNRGPRIRKKPFISRIYTRGDAKIFYIVVVGFCTFTRGELKSSFHSAQKKTIIKNTQSTEKCVIYSRKIVYQHFLSARLHKTDEDFFSFFSFLFLLFYGF